MPHAFNAAAPPTPPMAAVGLDFSGVLTYARKAVDLIQQHGDDVLDMLAAGFRAFAAVTGRDMIGVLAALSDANRSGQVVVAAIQAEFGI